MGGRSPPPPAAPDPVATAHAQGAQNRQTALTQQRINMTGQVTPEGSLTYRQTGSWDDGTPRFEAVQTLSPGEKDVYDIDVTNRANLGRVGGEQINRVGQLLSRPVSMSNEAAEGRLWELGRKRLDPHFAQEEARMDTQLANQGITRGSEAWRDATTRFDKGRNDAYNQLLLTGRGQAMEELLTERNQPLNEITALQSGSQVSRPNFTTTPQSSVSPVDYMGLVQSNYGQAMNQYNQQQGRETSERNAMLGGAFGLAAAPLGGWAYSGFKNPLQSQLGRQSSAAIY